MLQWTAAAAIGVALKDSLLSAADANDDPIVKAFSGKLEVTEPGDRLYTVANGGGNFMVSLAATQLHGSGLGR